MTAPRLRRGDRVVAAGLAGTVTQPLDGEVDTDRVVDQAEPCALVQWDGEPEPARVRISMLRKLPRRR